MSAAAGVTCKAVHACTYSPPESVELLFEAVDEAYVFSTDCRCEVLTHISQPVIHMLTNLPWCLEARHLAQLLQKALQLLCHLHSKSPRPASFTTDCAASVWHQFQHDISSCTCCFMSVNPFLRT